MLPPPSGKPPPLPRMSSTLLLSRSSSRRMDGFQVDYRHATIDWCTAAICYHPHRQMHRERIRRQPQENGMARWQKLLEIFIMTSTLIAGNAGAAPAEREITVNNLKIHYLEWGTAEKPPLILLHGIARVAHSFDHIAPHFANK